jgi:hypothetical protein
MPRCFPTLSGLYAHALGVFGYAAVPRPVASSFMPLRRTHQAHGRLTVRVLGATGMRCWRYGVFTGDKALVAFVGLDQ